MINTKNRAKDKVKETDWQNSLPKTNEMQSKWNTSERIVALDSAENLLGRWFGLLDRQKWSSYAIEHTRIDEIWGDGSDVHIGLHFL